MFIKKIFLLIIFIPAILFGQTLKQKHIRIIDRNIILEKNGKNQKLVFQKGLNYFDKKSRMWKRRDLTLKSRIITNYDFEVWNDFLFRCKKDLSIYKIEKNSKYIIYRPIGIKPEKIIRQDNYIKGLNSWTSTDFILYVIPEGLKAKLILKNKNAPTKFTFQISSNYLWKQVDNKLIFNDGEVVCNLSAEDNNIKYGMGQKLKLDIGIKNINDSYFLNLSVDTTQAVYPIIIDPTAIWQEDTTAIFDAFIIETYPTRNHGGSNYFGASTYPDGGGWRRGLIKCTLLDSIQKPVIIDSAFFIGTVYNSYAGKYIAGYLVSKDWGEGNSDGAEENGAVCWNAAKYNQVNWDSAGGDYYTNIATDTLDVSGLSKIDITNIVKAIIENNYDNHGILFRLTNEDNTQSRVFWYQSENATVSNRPKIEVYYSLMDTINYIAFGNGDGSSVYIDSFVTNNGIQPNSSFSSAIYNEFMKKYYNSNGDTTSVLTFIDYSDIPGLRLKPLGTLTENEFLIIRYGIEDTICRDTLNTMDYLINRIKNLFRFNRNTKIR